MLGTTLVLAFRSIRRHVLRSFLTVLGIVIGVAAVVTMVTLGNATSAAVQQSIANLGTNILQIYPSGGLRRGGGRSEEHTSELQSLMRISYAVFCLKKKIQTKDLH